MIERHFLKQQHGKFSGDQDMRLLLMAFANLDFHGYAPCDNTFVSHSKYDPNSLYNLCAIYNIEGELGFAFFDTFQVWC